MKTPLCTFIHVAASALAVNAAAQEWEQQSPFPSSVHVRGVDFVDAQNGWIVGYWDGGIEPGILRTDDGGVTWTQVQERNDGYLEDVDFVSPSHGWAVGDVILRTSDGGSSWIESPIPMGVQASKVQFLSPTVGFVSTRPASPQSDLHRTTDGGVTWTWLANLAVDSWFFADASVGWAANTNHQFVRSNDGGQTWTSVPMPPAAANSVGSTVEHVTDFDEAIVTTFHLESFEFRSHRTTDGGTTWTSDSSGAAKRWQRYVDPANGWGFGPGIAKTSDGGASWDEQFAGGEVAATLHDLFAFDTETAIAVGDNGYILRTTDGGASWPQVSQGTGNRIGHIAFADTRNGWATGEEYTILHTSDGGRNWKHQVIGAGFGPPMEIHAFSATDALIHIGAILVGGGSFNGFLATDDGGETWADPDPTDAWPFGSTHFADRERGWVVSPDGTEFSVTADGGQTWASNPTGVGPYFQPNRVTDVFFVDDQHGWFTGGFLVAGRTTDGGATWEEMEIPTTPLASIYRGVRFADPLHGWIHADNGVLFRTSDGGVTWTDQTIPNIIGQHIVDLVVTGPDSAFISSYDPVTGAWLRSTSDGGATWEFAYEGLYDHVTDCIAAVAGHVWTGGGRGNIWHRGPACPTDIDGDGSVSFGDLLVVLGSWGPCPGCPADVDDDGSVGLADLLSVLASWGDC